MVLRANALSIGYSGIRESTLETLIEMVNKHVNPIVFEKGSLGAVRAIMVLRANALSIGYSGIRESTLETLIEMVNKHVNPIVFEKGSLGASGDLAPLSHMVLTMIGEGEAEYEGEVVPSKEAMEKANINIVELRSKEGLALINGTQVMTAIGALTVYDAINLIKISDIAAALTLEALRGIKDAFDIRTHKVRPHKGQLKTAENILRLTEGSTFITKQGVIKISDIAAALTLEALRGIKDAFDIRTHKVRPHKGQLKTAENILRLTEGSTFITKQGELRVQDAYSLRCIPQVHGASKYAISYVEEKVLIEMNSVTDNPTILKDGDVISGGNFH